MKYVITLRSGVRLHGEDERSTENLLDGLAYDALDKLPEGWVWLAGHYLLAAEVVGIEFVGAE